MLSEPKKSEEQNVKDDISPNLMLKCELCDYICAKKDEMKEYKINRHQEVCHKVCTICGTSFLQNHELETERFNCTKCEKEFVLKWRLKKCTCKQINIVTIITIRRLARSNCFGANSSMRNLQPVISKTALIHSVNSNMRWML